MRKIILAATTIAALAVPAVSMADSPPVHQVINPNSPAGQRLDQGTVDVSTDYNGSFMGQYNSRVTGNSDTAQAQAQAGTRGQDTQITHAAEGIGSLATK